MDARRIRSVCLMVSVFVSVRPLSRVSLTLVITHPITCRMILKCILCFMIHFTTRNSIRIYSVPLEVSAATVTFNHEHLCVDVRGVSISFSTAYFEVADYSHCRIFARCKAQCVFERDGDPAWFCYNEAHYTANLCSLSTPVRSSALRRVTGKSLHTKTSAVYSLVSHFLSVRLDYASLDDRRLLEVTQSVTVPPGCIRSRRVVLDACVEGIYGI